MKSLWNDQAAKKFKSPLDLRVYTSRLLGQDASLVMHGGGNTSVKAKVRNLFGETEDILYVKGSGWDLATIEAPGFAPVKMDVLLKMAELKELSDPEMVRWQRAAMINPNAPNPSVEAILHAIIPFDYVDHTHADAVVTITNTPGGRKRIQEIYGDSILIVPYVMPGFILAKTIYDMTKDMDWQKCKGMILMNHGVFTFADDAKESYEQMIRLVAKAENYLKKNKANITPKKAKTTYNYLKIAEFRREVSTLRGTPVIVKSNMSPLAIEFSKSSNVNSIATRGPLTPDHVIRTKRIPMVISNSGIKSALNAFEKSYQKYYSMHAEKQHTCLDCAPRWAVWPKQGTLSFGQNLKEANIIADITHHTMEAIMRAEKLGGWKALSAKDLFEVEYWDLEQAKLKKAGSKPVLQGKVALVTGGGSGIGRACVESLAEQGAVVVAFDIDPKVKNNFQRQDIHTFIGDVTKDRDLTKAIHYCVEQFGGLDILISNAGIFPPGKQIEHLDANTWSKSIDINLTSHQRLMKEAIPFLKLGIDPSIVIIASKNVPAPGPGASAYSVAKAGLTQLARVASLELGAHGIRVNAIHPNQVFDTAIWSDEVLKNRARHYGLTVKDYKTNNLLQTEITSKDVAQLACTMAGPVFSKTTGSQVPVDGGNERVI